MLGGTEFMSLIFFEGLYGLIVQLISMKLGSNFKIISSKQSIEFVFTISVIIEKSDKVTF